MQVLSIITAIRWFQKLEKQDKDFLPPLVMTNGEIDELVEKAGLCIDLTLENIGYIFNL